MDPYTQNEGVTNNINAMVYDRLVELDRTLKIVPALATDWRVVNDTTWRLHLRRDVKFHDGTTMTADDVVYSIERSQQPTSQHAVFTRRLGKAVRIDDHTIELRQETPNPLLLEHALNTYVMSRARCIAHKVERVPNANENEEAFSSRQAMGTGAWILKEREPGVRTVLVRNPHHWRTFEGNVDEVVYTPIAHDATRTAALITGDIDFAQAVALQDLERLAKNPQIRITSGVENRLIFFGFDQARDELLYSNVKGRNPLKDVRVREAFYRAIDVEMLKSKVMHRQSAPTACMTMAAVGCLATELEARPGADIARARQLMADAGYAGGFELTLHCPNDRYVNDQSICLAVAPMLARIGVALKVDTRTKSLYFAKVLKHDTSFYLYGWGGNLTDAQFVLDPLLHSFDAKTQKGGDNNGGVYDPELDRLIDSAAVEMNTERRSALIRDALRRVHERFYMLPIHRQMLSWASRVNVQPVIMAGNTVRVDWIRMD
jgi:peptide/nickel transport system substrate-binding protein